MYKATSAILAAGVTAPLLATNGQILNDIRDHASRMSLSPGLPSVQLNLSQADIEAFLQSPEQLLAFLQSMWRATQPYTQNLGGLQGEALADFHASSVPYAGNASFFGGYNPSTLGDLYEEAYPGYHQAMAQYRQPSSDSGFRPGMFDGMRPLGGMGLGNAISGLVAPYPGYTSQAEFNDIVFDE